MRMFDSVFNINKFLNLKSKKYIFNNINVDFKTLCEFIKVDIFFVMYKEQGSTTPFE